MKYNYGDVITYIGKRWKCMTRWGTNYGPYTFTHEWKEIKTPYYWY